MICGSKELTAGVCTAEPTARNKGIMKNSHKSLYVVFFILQIII
jgi:hypothetical protein